MRLTKILVVFLLLLLVVIFVIRFIYGFKQKNVYNSPFNNCIILEGSRLCNYGIEVKINSIISSGVNYVVKIPDESAKIEDIKWCKDYVYIYWTGGDGFPSIRKYHLDTEKIDFLGYKQEDWERVACPF